LRKVVIILLTSILIEGCSVTRFRGKGPAEDSNNALTGNILESVKRQNITNSGFFIQKAEIEIESQNGKERYLGSIKFEKPDKYLISIRSRSGIEGARIYISNDTILVNDRINKKLYFGTSFYLKRKYGIDQSCLPLILGDIVLDKACEENQKKCLGDKIMTSCFPKGISLNYEIDCRKRKTLSVEQINSFSQTGIKIKYNNFRNVDNIFIPATVEFEDSQYNATIKIKLMKVDFTWNGSVKFVPGKGYELIELV